MEVMDMIRSPLFSDLVALRDTMEQLASERSDPFQVLWSTTANGRRFAQTMPLDAFATDEQVVILAAVPGMRPEDLDLTVHQDTITLSGTVGDVTETEEAKGATWYVHELSNGTYRRSITLPFPVDADRAEATFEHGMLRVTLPKAESARPKRITIGSGSRQALGDGESSESDE
jgi:HSP20 family protein